MDGQKRPVMVWLHGGGFYAGSSIEQIAYEGENMCKLGQVVVVSVNHRLNLLGYLDLSPFGEESGEKIGRALMKELKVTEAKALESVPCEALVRAYNRVMPALVKVGEYIGGTPYKNAFYKGEPVKNGCRRYSTKSAGEKG